MSDIKDEEAARAYVEKHYGFVSPADEHAIEIFVAGRAQMRTEMEADLFKARNIEVHDGGQVMHVPAVDYINALVGDNGRLEAERDEAREMQAAHEEARSLASHKLGCARDNNNRLHSRIVDLEAAKEGLRKRLAERAAESDRRFRLAEENGERWGAAEAKRADAEVERDKAYELSTKMERDRERAEERAYMHENARWSIGAELATALDQLANADAREFELQAAMNHQTETMDMTLARCDAKDHELAALEGENENLRGCKRAVEMFDQLNAARANVGWDAFMRTLPAEAIKTQGNATGGLNPQGGQVASDGDVTARAAPSPAAAPASAVGRPCHRCKTGKLVVYDPEGVPPGTYPGNYICDNDDCDAVSQVGAETLAERGDE